MTIQANLSAVTTIRAKLKGHPLCLTVTESSTHLTVIFPEGFQLDGVRVSMDNGVLWAYEKALEKMEKGWINGGRIRIAVYN